MFPKRSRFLCKGKTMLDKIIAAAVGAGILGSAYLLDLLIGIVKVIFTPDLKWSWKKMFQDLVKAIIWTTGVIGTVALLEITNWYAKKVGADMSFLQDASFPILIAGILGGVGWYLTNTLKNIVAFINRKTEVKIDESQADYTGLTSDVVKTAKEIAELITPKHTVNDRQTDEKAESSKEEITEVGQGGDNPLSRRLPDGDNDYGKGWQCTKYSWYLASGIRMNYAPHPDYGPCDGRDMVDYLVNKLGWVRCGKRNGAIFAYSAGAYGHTGNVVDAANNIVNDANWTPLRVSTHYLNLDAVGAVYACPKSMLEAEKPKPALVPATPTPAPQPAPSNEVSYTYQEGDTFGAVILKLGLQTNHGLWDKVNGDVAFYTNQLHEQGIYGNIPVGTTIKLRRRQ